MWVPSHTGITGGYEEADQLTKAIRQSKLSSPESTQVKTSYKYLLRKID